MPSQLASNTFLVKPVPTPQQSTGVATLIKQRAERAMHEDKSKPKSAPDKRIPREADLGETVQVVKRAGSKTSGLKPIRSHAELTKTVRDVKTAASKEPGPSVAAVSARLSSNAVSRLLRSR